MASTRRRPPSPGVRPSPRTEPPRTRPKVAVIGGSRAGQNLVLAIARRGSPVVFIEPDLAHGQAAMQQMADHVDTLYKRGVIEDSERPRILERVRFGPGWDRLNGVAAGVVATDGTARPTVMRQAAGAIGIGQALGVLVDSPAEIDPLLASVPGVSWVPIRAVLSDFDASVFEVLGHPKTSNEARHRLASELDGAGLCAIPAPGAAGTLVDRMLMLMLNEACALLSEGKAGVQTVDRVFRLGTIHNLGPLQYADLVGIDRMAALGRRLVEETGDPRFAPAKLLQAYVDAGHLGHRSGRGFYRYATS